MNAEASNYLYHQDLAHTLLKIYLLIFLPFYKNTLAFTCQYWIIFRVQQLWDTSSFLMPSSYDRILTSCFLTPVIKTSSVPPNCLNEKKEANKHKLLSPTPLSHGREYSSASPPCVLQAASQMFLDTNRSTSAMGVLLTIAGKCFSAFNKETVRHLLIHVFKLHCFS